METQEEAEVESFAFLPTSVRNRGNHHADYESFDDSIESRGSVNSSYADLLEASDVVIRDQYDGSLRSVPFHYNPVTANLVKCKKSMIHPYYRMLQLIAWRPFAKDSVKFQCLWSSINIVYPLLILFLLFFWYIARVLTCQGMLSGNITPTTPKPPTPAPTRPPHNITNWTDILPAMNLSEYDLSSSDPVKPCRCKHIFGTYIVPNILYFLAYIIGFYHFRIQESEGLYALMEKVYLQSMAPQKITKTLQLFLYAGFLWLLCDMGLLIYFHYVFGLDSTTGIIPDQTPTMQYSFAAMLVFAGLVADVVNVAVIINFVGQCQLLKCYIEGITQRLEEKTTELRYAMKDILDVKQNISRVNGLLALNTSCVVFNMSLMTMVGFSRLVTYNGYDSDLWAYRALSVVLWGSILIFSLVQVDHLDLFQVVKRILIWFGFIVSFPETYSLLCIEKNYEKKDDTVPARLTLQGDLLKEKALAVRVFGYQTHTQLDIDSFLNFLRLVDLEAKLFTIPVKAPYLWGVLVLASQILILVFQSGAIIVGDSKWI